jgi:hypothetical protein
VADQLQTDEKKCNNLMKSIAPQKAFVGQYPPPVNRTADEPDRNHQRRTGGDGCSNFNLLRFFQLHTLFARIVERSRYASSSETETPVGTVWPLTRIILPHVQFIPSTVLTIERVPKDKLLIAIVEGVWGSTVKLQGSQACGKADALLAGRRMLDARFSGLSLLPSAVFLQL